MGAGVMKTPHSTCPKGWSSGYASSGRRAANCPITQPTWTRQARLSCRRRTTPPDQLSILLQETERLDDEHWRCLVGFLTAELALPHMWPGAALLVLEGPRTVAHVLIESLLGKGDTSRA